MCEMSPLHACDYDYGDEDDGNEVDHAYDDCGWRL